MTARVWIVLVAVLLTVTGCSHNTNGMARSAEAATTSRPPVPGLTEIVLRPVDAHGDVEPGWSVNDAASAVDCDNAKSSPNAVTSGVVAGCGAYADGLGACWTTSTKYSAVCIRLPINPKAQHLLRIDTEISVRGEAAENPTPIAIGLDDGRVCSIVRGGAWGAGGAPDFLCSPEPNLDGVWGGITKTAAGWSVRVGPATNTADRSTHEVRSAYYVGIA